jgi:hypothetical protein
MLYLMSWTLFLEALQYIYSSSGCISFSLVCPEPVRLYTYGTLIPAMGPVYVKTVKSSPPFCHPVLDDIRRDQYGDQLDNVAYQSRSHIAWANDTILRLGCAVGLGTEGTTPL